MLSLILTVFWGIDQDQSTKLLIPGNLTDLKNRHLIKKVQMVIEIFDQESIGGDQNFY